MMLLIVFLVVALGSLMQRISGMGVGLIAGPVLAILLGPVEGILVINVIAFINAAVTTWTVRDRVDWKMFGLIGGALVFGIVPGALLVANTNSAMLQILVGVLLLLALAVTTFAKPYIPKVEGRAPAVASGVIGGFMNTLGGIAGPAITVYAQAARWEQRTYAATLQPIFMIAGAMSFTAKILAGAGDLSGTDPWIWPVAVIALFLGVFLGVRLEDRFSKGTARNIALSLATLGGVTAIVRGVTSL